MKKKFIILLSLIIMALTWGGCKKVFIHTIGSKVTGYWVLDRKSYEDYDTRNGEFLGSQVVAFHEDSHYTFDRDGRYNGIEITNGEVVKVGGRYTIVDNHTIIMDYQGYNDENIDIQVLTRDHMQLKLTYIKNGIETDETLYFYR